MEGRTNRQGISSSRISQESAMSGNLHVIELAAAVTHQKAVSDTIIGLDSQ